VSYSSLLAIIAPILVAFAATTLPSLTRPCRSPVKRE
jgi:hypothetical protein